MKKWIMGIMASVLAVFGVMSLTGCDLTDEQIQTIAQNAGLGASVTWIAYDNPDTNATDLVKGVLDLVVEKASGVQTGYTYTAVIFPQIEKYVTNGAIPSQYAPIVLAGSLAMLNGIDLTFALHPNWKVKEGLALKVVTSFCMGAKQGLAMSGKDPAIIQARAFSAERARVLKSK